MDTEYTYKGLPVTYDQIKAIEDAKKKIKDMYDIQGDSGISDYERLLRAKLLAQASGIKTD